MSFARPLLLVALLALPIWWWIRTHRRRPAAIYSDLEPIAAVSRARISSNLEYVEKIQWPEVHNEASCDSIALDAG